MKFKQYDRSPVMLYIDICAQIYPSPTTGKLFSTSTKIAEEAEADVSAIKDPISDENSWSPSVDQPERGGGVATEEEEVNDRVLPELISNSPVIFSQFNAESVGKRTLLGEESEVKRRYVCMSSYGTGLDRYILNNEYMCVQKKGGDDPERNTRRVENEQSGSSSDRSDNE